MTTRRRLTVPGAVLAAAVAAAVLQPLPARAQASGQTTIDITLPDIVVLHYFSTVDVTISQDALMDALSSGESGGTLAISESDVSASGGFSQDLAVSPAALDTDPTSAVLTLQNAWAVRSISLSGGTNTQVAITTDTDTLSHTSGSEISISSSAVAAGGSSGATINFAAPGLTSPQKGDVQLTLDLSNAKSAGDYTGGQYTITAQNI